MKREIREIRRLLEQGIETYGRDRIANKDLSESSSPLIHLACAFESVLSEMRTHARADHTIQHWVDILDTERDNFLDKSAGE